MRSIVIAALSGALFAVGLLVSGAAQPHVVFGALDPFGSFDVTLYAFFVSAVLVRVFVVGAFRPAALQRLVVGAIDRKLVVGALVFGTGWGLAGLCPGPSVVGLFVGGLPLILFFLAMMLGLHLGSRIRFPS